MKLMRIIFLGLLIALAGCRHADSVDHLSLARDALAHKDIGASLDHLKRYLRNHPGSFDARLMLGRIYLDMARPETALADFDKALSIQPDNGKALAGKIEALIALGRHDQVVALHIDPDRYERAQWKVLRALQALALSRAGMSEEAEKALDELASQGAVSEFYWRARIDQALAKGNTSEAASMLKKARSQSPNSHELELLEIRLTEANHGKKNGDGQLERLRDIGRSEAREDIALESTYLLIINKVREGALKEAEKSARTLLKERPRDFRALYLGGLVALVSGKYDVAKRRLIRLEKRYRIAPARLLLGAAYMAAGEYEQARFYLANYHASNTDDLWAARLLIRTEMILGDNEAARMVFNRIKYPKDDAELLILDAFLDIREGLRAQAVGKIQQAAKSIGEDVAARKLLTRAYLEVGDTDAAAKQANQLLAMTPGDQEAMALMLEANLSRRRYAPLEAALARYRQAGGDSVWADTVEAVLMAEQGQIGKAVDHLTRLAHKHPKNGFVLVNLARAAERAGSYPIAEKYYRQALLYGGSRQVATRGLVRIAYALDDLERLEKALETARASNYKDVFPLLYLGAYHLRHGNLDQVRKIASEIGLLRPDNPAKSLLLAGVALREKDLDAARRLVSAALRTHPDNQAMIMTAAGIALQMNDVDKAASLLASLAGSNGMHRSAISLSDPLLMKWKSAGFNVSAWLRAVLGRTHVYHDTNRVMGTDLSRFLGLKNAEVKLASGRIRVDTASNQVQRNYFYGRKGTLARINRTIFFKYYAAMTKGWISPYQLARGPAEGMIAGADVYEESRELQRLLWKEKRWKVRQYDKRYLRMPSWIAWLGLVMIAVVIGVRWKRSKAPLA